MSLYALRSNTSLSSGRVHSSLEAIFFIKSNRLSKVFSSKQLDMLNILYHISCNIFNLLSNEKSR